MPEAQRVCGACLLNPPQMDVCLAAVDYGYPWSGVIGAFKFRQQPHWARSLAQLLRATPAVEAAIEGAHLVVPVPLSAARLRERGYNQALELARALAPRKTDSAILLRTQDGQAQHHLPRALRLRNLAHAYAVDPMQYPKIRGRRVVLVDDVLTTGTTLNRASYALRQAGASHITGLVFARTPG